MSDFKQILTAELISITGGAIAGGLLASYKEIIYLVPGILIFIPGFLEMRGNLSGSLAARLGSSLHLGQVKSLKNSRIVNDNLIATSVLTIIVSLLLSLIAYLINLIMGINSPSIIIIGLTAGVLSGALMIPITLLTTFYLHKKGLDPDNIMGPYVTTIGDIICMASLILAVKLF